LVCCFLFACVYTAFLHNLYTAAAVAE